MQDDVVISQAMLDDALDVILPLEEGGVDALGPVSPACGGGCWGPLLGETAPCSFGFQRPQNPGHFKNKFCPSCRAGGILLPVSRVRALTAEQVAVLKHVAERLQQEWLEEGIVPVDNACGVNEFSSTARKVGDGTTKLQAAPQPLTG